MKRKLFEIVGDYSMTSTRRMQAPGNMRGATSLSGGRPVRPSLGSVLDIEADEAHAAYQAIDKLQKIAVVYIKNEEGKVLAVSKGKDVSNMNLPGGHVKEGEDLETAAARELEEETGVLVRKLYPIHAEVTDSGKYVTVFYAPEWRGKIRSSHEGTAAWVDKQMILGSEYGKFFATVLDKLEGIVE